MTEQNKDASRGSNVSKSLEQARIKNKGYGTLQGISKKDSRINLLPRDFHVYSKAKK